MNARFPFVVLVAAVLGTPAPAEPGKGVAEIFIFRVAKTPVLDLARFPRVTPVSTSVECARRLAELGRIAPAAVADVERAVDQGAAP